MKVLLINGSPKAAGTTFRALREAAEELNREGIETEIIQTGKEPVRDCMGCGVCRKQGKCVFGDEDGINALIEKAAGADGFLFGTPVYFAHPTGQVLSVLDRLFYAGKRAFAHKPGACVICARRAGTTASFDVMNKYFAISEMPIVSSTYWNMTHGNGPDEAEQDGEGMQTIRNLARNMAWLLRCIEAGREAGVVLPETETGARTNFIR